MWWGHVCGTRKATKSVIHEFVKNHCSKFCEVRGVNFVTIPAWNGIASPQLATLRSKTFQTLLKTITIKKDEYQWEETCYLFLKNDEQELILLYRHGCFTGKYTTHKIHEKLHLGPTCISGVFSISFIPRFFTAVCVWVVVCLYNKKNITY